MTNDNKTRALLALLVGGALLLTAPTATANEEEDLGRLRVLDDLDDRRHDRIVSCDFWIAGRDMPADNGTLVIKTVPEGDEVLNDTWEAEGDNDGFLNGPYELEPGTYVVKAFYEHEPNGDVFLTENGNHVDRKRLAAEPREFTVVECEEPDPLCPTDLEAEALPDGSVRLTFTPANGTEGNNVYRTVADQDPVLMAELPPGATEFVDESTEPGTTYTYEVRSVFEGRETPECPTVEVTAIPVFPTVLGAVAASTVGILAYAGLRRRL